MDDPARLIYLLILLAAIGSGVAYMARQNLGKSVQQFLVWVLLLAGLVIVYGYKDMLMGQLFPATGVARDEGLVFYKNTDGHFLYEQPSQWRGGSVFGGHGREPNCAGQKNRAKNWL